MYKIIKVDGGLANVKGFFCGATNIGMRVNPNNSNVAGDLAFLRSDTVCAVSATFTRNTFQAAPIKHFQKYPKGFQTDFILVNAKNANAMTGAKGIEDIDTILSALSKIVKIKNPIMASTGVIGYRLPVDKFLRGLNKLDFNSKDSDATARAIMTTDTFKKELSYRVELDDGSSFHIAAIAKGAGMINPAMATMLCFIATDANVPKADMDGLLESAVQKSFNRISVDGDTSTNDTAILLANKTSAAYNKEAFAMALDKITFEIAMMILRDGEGATKLVTFEVNGAKSKEEARMASVALSNSLLVKTALFGEDPNWGRIASTIGASGIVCDEETLSIYYDDLLIYSANSRELDEKREHEAYKIMKQAEFKIRCEIGQGDGSYTSYGCDLSYDYVKINAEYRT